MARGPAVIPVYKPAQHLLFMLHSCPGAELFREQAVSHAISARIVNTLSSGPELPADKQPSTVEKLTQAVRAIDAADRDRWEPHWYIQRLYPLLQFELRNITENEKPLLRTRQTSERLLLQVEMLPAVEATRGNKEASEVCSRIAAALVAVSAASPRDRLQAVMDAIAQEDTANWSLRWHINMLQETLQAALNRAIMAHVPMQYQAKRYAQLRAHPELCDNILHGLTPKISLLDSDEFIRTLMDAGRRNLSKGDEMEAADEEDVLHVALSYRHIARHDEGGTLNEETAIEALEVIRNMFVKSDGKVRVWVDQNLHRYGTEGPWYKRGFLPYATLPVVSALSADGGFRAACERPWIWFETGMALAADGVNCRVELIDSIRDVIVFPENARLDVVENYRTTRMPFGSGSSV